MRGITLYLDELVEERERERRRSPKAAVIAIVAALAGFLAGRQQVQKPELRVALGAAPGVAWPAFAPVEVAIVPPGGAGGSTPPADPRGGGTDLLTITRSLTDLVEPDSLVALPPHLCVSPKAVFFRQDDARTEARVTISNPGTTGVIVTGIALGSDRARSGVALDTGGCDGTILSPGEHCTMTVKLLERIGETTELWIYNDAGEPVPLTVMAPEKS